jgi:single-strand DNA-binding protein
MSVNKVMLIGNLGHKPEIKNTNSGMSVTTLRIATSDRRKDKQSDQWVDQTEWHSVVVFGSTADNCCKYLDKGRQVYVEGKLQTRKWQDKEGKDRWSTEVLANKVKFLGSKGGDSAYTSGETLEEIPF